MSYFDGIRFGVEKTTEIEHHHDREHRKFLEWRMNGELRDDLIAILAKAVARGVPPPPSLRPAVVSVREAALFVRHGIPVGGPPFAGHQRGRVAHLLAQALGVVPKCEPCSVTEWHRR